MNSNITHCKHGHEYTPASTWLNKKGSKVCKTCVLAKRHAAKPLLPKPTTAERFWAKVEKNEGCWLWKASCNEDGYGVFRHPDYKNMRGAHRISYELAYGKPAIGSVIRHTCDNPKCVKPGHLIPGTQLQNIQDAVERGRTTNASAQVTHCPKGHEYTVENTYTPPSTTNRQCRICRARHSANRKK